MRAAKISLMLSLSLLLFAASWAILTGSRTQMATAQEINQITSLLAPEIGSIGQKWYVATTADGSLYRFKLRSDSSVLGMPVTVEEVAFLGTLGGVVSSEASSLSDLKRSYGGDK